MICGCDTATRMTEQDYKYLKERGMQFVMRYFVPTSMGKSLTKQEVESAHKAGIALGLVYETVANRAIGGYEAGVYDATVVNDLIIEFAVPKKTVIYFAVDFDAVNCAEAVKDYFHGILATLNYHYDIGAYGGRKILAVLEAQTTACTHYWSAYAWKYGITGDYDVSQLSASTQFGHLLIDHDEAKSLDGFWGAKMEGKEIYQELKEYLDSLEEGEELTPEIKLLVAEAKALGITDGSRPLGLCLRYEAILLALRAYNKALEVVAEKD